MEIVEKSKALGTFKFQLYAHNIFGTHHAANDANMDRVVTDEAEPLTISNEVARVRTQQKEATDEKWLEDQHVHDSVAARRL
eukprot:6472771-Amphidinium_carterae.1